MKNIVYLKNFDGEFYCPVTGKMILSPELFEGPSDATVCVYVSICDEFEYSVNGFEDVFNEFLEEDYDKIEDVFEKTRKKLKMDKVVFFCFQNYGADPCGNHEDFSMIGIDFSKEVNLLKKKKK